jgi:hypothetical protein
LASDIPAGDRKLVNLFLRCREANYSRDTVKIRDDSRSRDDRNIMDDSSIRQ